MRDFERFSYQVTKDGQIRCVRGGRHVRTVGGREAQRLTAALATAGEDEAQLLLAKATGNYKRGNERRGGSGSNTA